ncbi:Nitrogen regulation protein NtrB [hydrothermal vent metagenome]|uniref:Sensory histidine kinase/phosphatase NtrB n=1 Tax=hydrothermal vent metagenome TaxID=652676 RepID=A0A3B0WIE4_9ZZZZ
MVATEYNSPQTIIDNLHSAIVVIGENLQIFCINPAAEMLFHISNNRAAKKNLRQLIINEHAFFDRLERSLLSGHPYTVYESRLHLHNHKVIDVDYSVSPIQYLPQGKFLLLEFIRLKAQQKLLHEESIHSQYEASKSLLRGLAHEIKNPLGGIRGSAQLLEKELTKNKNSDNSNKQFTQIIINEADRLKNLLDRMVGPKNIPTKTEINIHKILEHVRQLVLAENHNISIIVDYDPSIPELYGDESMMIQIILNITRNAVIAIFSVDNSVHTDGKIIYKTRTQRNCKIGLHTHPLVARIDIEDNGAGVAEELQEKIFMPMITGHAEGTGLGLSIAQSLVHQHDGLIEFTSESGETIFTILIPINMHNETSKEAGK